MSVAPGPRLLHAAALLSEVADEVVVRTVRDTHQAWADRVHRALRSPTRDASRVPEALHRGVATAVYAGVGAGFRTLSAGLGVLADHEVGPPLEETAAGRAATSAVNGIIGDRLARERPRLAVPLAVRRDGRDVPATREALRTAYAQATPRVAVLLHGLSESDASFDRHREHLGTTYADTLERLGWTPVLLRANTGLGLLENGAALAALVQDLVDAWPVDVAHVSLVGHSMGGLIMRAACAVRSEASRPWAERVSHVVTLGTPHLGAPLAGGVGAGARHLTRLPETAAFGRILDQRSAGVLDLVEGLADDVPPLPHARYHLVSATLTRSPHHPVGRFLGDLFVRQPSAYGRSTQHPGLFPGADVLHLPGAGHFDLLNHPRVHDALREWLA